MWLRFSNALLAALPLGALQRSRSLDDCGEGGGGGGGGGDRSRWRRREAKSVQEAIPIAEGKVSTSDRTF